MTILAVVLLSQMISPPDPPPWPPRYTVRRGHTATLPLAPASCNAAPVRVLGKKRFCDSDGAIHIYIPRRQKLGTYDIIEKHDYLIGHLEVVTGTDYPRLQLFR